MQFIYENLGVQTEKKCLKWLMDTIANTENKVSIYANNMMPKSRDSMITIPEIPIVLPTPRKENTMEKTKTCKVSYILTNNEERPFLKLTGKWLDKIGFNVGTTLKVYEGKEMLLLIKDKEN